MKLFRHSKKISNFQLADKPYKGKWQYYFKIKGNWVIIQWSWCPNTLLLHHKFIWGSYNKSKAPHKYVMEKSVKAPPKAEGHSEKRGHTMSRSHWVENFSVRYMGLICHDILAPQINVEILPKQKQIEYTFIYLTPLLRNSSSPPWWRHSCDHVPRPSNNISG